MTTCNNTDTGAMILLYFIAIYRLLHVFLTIHLLVALILTSNGLQDLNY